MLKTINYIGSKQTLLPFLKEVMVTDEEDKIFYDLFCGTTVVSNFIARETNWKLNLSDFSLYSKILSTLISFKQEDVHINILRYLDTLSEESVFFNEFGIGGTPSTCDKSLFENQTIKSRMFFRGDVAKKIDGIRNGIKNINCSEEEKNYYLLFLLHYIDKYANTSAVYGAYLKYDKFPDKNVDFVSKELIEAFKRKRRDVVFRQGDIFETLRSIPYDSRNIFYLDPPYNTRRYESNYHILNYIVDLDFKIEDIKINSKTAMPVKQKENLFASKKTFKDAFRLMMSYAMEKSDLIYISFNSEGEFTQSDMEEYIREHSLILETFTKKYPKFKSRKEDKKAYVEEIIWKIRKY